MGLIEDSIFTIYSKALEEGNVRQAKKAVELAKVLKGKVEQEGFIDLSMASGTRKTIVGSFFEPFPYRYYPNEGVVVIDNSAISLTQTENKLFNLFSSNESLPDNIRIITKQQIQNHLWGTASVTDNSVRISVLRLRRKIKVNNRYESMLLNVYRKGYIFIGKRSNNDE